LELGALCLAITYSVRLDVEAIGAARLQLRECGIFQSGFHCDFNRQDFKEINMILSLTSPSALACKST
jgi:hypothetical protein